METLVGLQNSYLSITNSFPSNRKIPILFHKNIHRTLDLHQNTWKLHAEAKGFGNVPAETQKQNGKLDASKRNNRRDNNNNNDDNDEKIPSAVWERIIGRMLFYVGAPMVGGVALLQVLDIVKQQQLWDVPVWLPFLTTFITFGASTLGIAYGTLSASWDSEKEGTFLGLEQAQKNWVDMWAEDGVDDEENRWSN